MFDKCVELQVVEMIFIGKSFIKTTSFVNVNKIILGSLMNRMKSVEIINISLNIFTLSDETL